LSVDRSGRYASVAAILSDLDARTTRAPDAAPRPWRRWLSGGAAALLLIVLAWTGWRLLPRLRTGARGAAATTPVPAATPVSAAKVVGVVPFENRTGRADLDWCGAGLARLVMDNLAQSSHVRVVSADTIDALRSRTRDPGDLSRAAAGA